MARIVGRAPAERVSPHDSNSEPRTLRVEPPANGRPRCEVRERAACYNSLSNPEKDVEISQIIVILVDIGTGFLILNNFSSSFIHFIVALVFLKSRLVLILDQRN